MEEWFRQPRTLNLAHLVARETLNPDEPGGYQPEMRFAVRLQLVVLQFWIGYHRDPQFQNTRRIRRAKRGAFDEPFAAREDGLDPLWVDLVSAQIKEGILPSCDAQDVLRIEHTNIPRNEPAIAKGPGRCRWIPHIALHPRRILDG